MSIHDDVNSMLEYLGCSETTIYFPLPRGAPADKWISMSDLGRKGLLFKYKFGVMGTQDVDVFIGYAFEPGTDPEISTIGSYPDGSYQWLIDDATRRLAEMLEV